MTWWRRQRRAIIGLLLAVGAVVGVHVWLDVIPAAPRTSVRTIVVDGRAEVHGHTLSVAASRWGEFDAPRGSTTLTVVLHARSDEGAESCGTFRLSERDGSRLWLDAGSAVDVDIDDEDTETGCREGNGGYRILTVFLLPDDARGPFWLDVPVEDEVARFRIDP
ncbi:MULTISPECIES: hypothetical protein [Microbacterium]|uniref:hypothetical protein n=1 Tax=Microbacterium TaxID=33882 RepID=UPI0030101A2F